jgi:chemotaxis protein histidine kinase CheA
MDRARAEELFLQWQGGQYKDQAYVVSLSNALKATDNCEPMYKEFFGDFYDESQTFINAMKGYIVEFRAGQFSDTSVYEAFRLAHMVKGAAATMGYKVISSLSGGLEHMFSDVKDKKLTMTAAHVDLVESTMALISQHLEELKANP